MKNTNILWVIEQYSKDYQEWKFSSAYYTRQCAREMAKKLVGKTRIRKYVDMTDHPGWAVRKGC